MRWRRERKIYIESRREEENGKERERDKEVERERDRKSIEK